MNGLSFKISAWDRNARTGLLSTRHGDIQTPAFMPVGTAGAVKAMMPDAVATTGADIVLGNTYHLMLRPGAERVAKLGGLHNFMNWHKPILTDSGGFQVMSLAQLRKMNEKGVTFQSHLDGTKYELTPERSIEIQYLLDSNITMVLDECPRHGRPKSEIAHSMELTHRWAGRSRDAFQERSGYGIFGIVQGNIFEDLREESARGLTGIGFDGYAIGGLAVGEPQNEMFMTLDFTVPHLPHGQPRYLMGVGTPADIVGAVERGIDMFDCVMPTRSGRTGKAFTRRGELNIRNARHAEDPRPLDDHCTCPACRDFSRAYLHHLFKANEILGPVLLTWHNLTYYQDLMMGLRKSINEGTLTIFTERFHNDKSEGDIAPL
ncbi:MAG: tRNA guanosine(34) transglycosylase Tgt [Rhodospirillaceae bacterium]|nr:tRNA guanosine(34) transglycosylase Tgt [Rhodospirillaceae bacterium]